MSNVLGTSSSGQAITTTAPQGYSVQRVKTNYGSFYAYIYKNDDDWYYVAARRREDIAERLYKCDQVDGLIQLMDYVFKEVYN